MLQALSISVTPQCTETQLQSNERSGRDIKVRPIAHQARVAWGCAFMEI